MAKGIFVTKVRPTYDDLPEHRYHFPKRNLGRVESCVGDWIIYYEPRRTTGDLSSRGGRQAYFATAKVKNVESDPSRKDHYYAFVEHYLEFPRAVPFREGLHYYESALRKEDGSTNRGFFGWAARILPDEEYEVILAAGMAHMIGDQPDFSQSESIMGLAESVTPFERPMIESVTQRPFRDKAFRSAVCLAYKSTCAVTGLKIINGGGRPEVQAAHIRPVSDKGPDAIRNGIALCGTVHWMFDRGLISIDDDYNVLVANDSVPDQARSLLDIRRRLAVPDRAELAPHPEYLRYHRENIFKG